MISGFISSRTGGDFIEGFKSGAIGGALQGGSFGSGFLSGAIGSGISSGLIGINAPGAAIVGGAALSGGIGAELSGGDFWRGAATGATIAGLNHLSHAGEFREQRIMRKVTNFIKRSGDLNIQDNVIHPGKINLRKSSTSKVAVHLLKGIRYHTKTNTNIDLVGLFDCLDNTCLMNVGTHYSGDGLWNLSYGRLGISITAPRTYENLLGKYIGTY